MFSDCWCGNCLGCFHVICFRCVLGNAGYRDQILLPVESRNTLLPYNLLSGRTTVYAFCDCQMVFVVGDDGTVFRLIQNANRIRISRANLVRNKCVQVQV